MASPDYLGKVQTPSLVGNGSAQTSPTFPAELGDLIVVSAATLQGTSTYGLPTNSGAPLAWTLHQDARAATAGQVTVWSATVDAARASMTVTVPRTSGTEAWGLVVTRWGNAAAGASAKKTSTTGGAPQVTLTTTAANSAVLVVAADYWETNGTRVWVPGAGSASEILYSYNSGAYSVYGATYLDAGAAGSKTVGLSSPGDMGYGIVALEIAYSLAGTVMTADGIPDDGGVGAPSALYGPTMTADGIPDDGGVGSPTFIPGAVTVTAPGIPAEDGIGSPTATSGSWRQVTAGVPWRQAVTSPERVVGWRVELIDQVSREHRMSLPVVAGSVDFRGDDVEQWACSLTVRGAEWVPQKATDPLGPVSGLLARVWWTVAAGGMSPMEIPMGTYVLEDPQVSDSNDGSPEVTVTGRDPLALIRRTGYGSATVAVGGLTVPAALSVIMRAVAPATPVRIDQSSTITLPAVYEVGMQDVGKDLTEISGIGDYICRTDREGSVVIGPSPEPDEVLADWQEGPDCAVTELKRSIDTARMVNSVTVVSSSTEVDPPVVGYAEDDDPASPTYVGGPFQRRGITVQSDVVASEEAATALARRTLSGRKRPTESVDVTVLPRGDLDYRSLVNLYRPSTGVGGLYRVGGWSMSITPPGAPPALMRVTMLPRVTL